MLLHFKKIIELISCDPNKIRFSFDDIDQKSNILITFTNADNKLCTHNLTEILQKADLEHFSVSNRVLSEIENNLNSVLPEFKNRQLHRNTNSNLSSVEKLAINQYTRGSSVMNGFLRKQYTLICTLNDEKEIDAFLKKTILQLALVTSGLNKISPELIKHETEAEKTFRGEKSPFANLEKRELEVQTRKSSHESSFVSTSTDYSAAMRFASTKDTLAPHGKVPVFLVLDAIYGKNITQYSEFSSSEKEYLILPCEIDWYDMKPGDELAPVQFSGKLIRPLHSEQELNKTNYLMSDEYKEISDFANFTLSDKKYKNDFANKLSKEINEAILQGDESKFTRLIDFASYHTLSKAFILAAEQGHLTIVEKLFEKGVNINSVNDNNETALTCAAKMGNHDVALFLIQNKSNMHQDKYNMTPLMHAAKGGHEDVVKLLLKANPEIDAIEIAHGYNALRFAVEAQNENIVSQLLKNGAETDAFDKKGVTPYIASLSKKNDAIKTILSTASDVNKIINGETPLMKAAAEGNIDMLKLLIKNGADPNVENLDGLSALHFAVRTANIAAVKFLISNGADVNHCDSNGNSSLPTALSNNNLDITRHLLSSGADIDLKNHNGYTPLETTFLLAEISDSEIDPKLLQVVEEAKKIPPLIRALKNGNNTTTLKFLDAGYNNHTSNDRGLSALETAIYLKHPLTELIFNKTAIDPNSAYAKNVMALTLDKGNELIARKLFDLGFDLNGCDRLAPP